MVELRSRKYGAELYDDRIRLVGLSTAAGRNRVDMLDDLPFDAVEGEKIDREGSLYMAVPEKNTIIKRVKISTDRSLDPDKLAQFELIASLLEDDDQYYLESFEINGGSERLAVAYRRQDIDRRLKLLQKRLIKPSGFKLRSWAMAAGYLNYCRHEGGRLVCLIDITDNIASYCFVENNRPIHLGAVISNAVIGDPDETSTKAFLLDIVATVQYQMLTCNKLSQSVPLSMIVVTGGHAGDEMAAGIEDVIGIKTALPVMRKELFAPEILAESHKYLIGLGLTVD